MSSCATSRGMPHSSALSWMMYLLIARERCSLVLHCTVIVCESNAGDSQWYMPKSCPRHSSGRQVAHSCSPMRESIETPPQQGGRRTDCQMSVTSLRVCVPQHACAHTPYTVHIHNNKLKKNNSVSWIFDKLHLLNELVNKLVSVFSVPFSPFSYCQDILYWHTDVIFKQHVSK